MAVVDAVVNGAVQIPDETFEKLVQFIKDHLDDMTATFGRITFNAKNGTFTIKMKSDAGFPQKLAAMARAYNDAAFHNAQIGSKYQYSRKQVDFMWTLQTEYGVTSATDLANKFAAGFVAGWNFADHIILRKSGVTTKKDLKNTEIVYSGDRVVTYFGKDRKVHVSMPLANAARETPSSSSD